MSLKLDFHPLALDRAPPTARPRKRRVLRRLGALFGSSAPVSTTRSIEEKTPARWPRGIEVRRAAYENWSGEIKLASIWMCSPRSAEQVVTLANWAHANGYKLRPSGRMLTWTPLTVDPRRDIEKTVLLDTTRHMTSVEVDPDGPIATVTAEPGATLERILATLQAAGLGLAAAPAPGALTLGGALAVNAHGTGIPADGEQRIAGTSYGSLSNLVTSLTAVVWDAQERRYVARTFARADPRIAPLLTGLGRCFLTSITLQAGANHRLRCQSVTDIPITELLAPDGSEGRTLARFLSRSGRAEVIWYPFTERPWLKVWTRTPAKPPASREVRHPFNYPFTDSIRKSTSTLIARVLAGNGGLVPLFGALQGAMVERGLRSTQSRDLWGWSKDLLMYVRPSTLRESEGGGVVITSRANLQRAVHEFARFHAERLEHYRRLGHFPINGPVQIRCTGLDRPDEVEVASAVAPAFSALRPDPEHPEWDCALWLNVMSTPGTPGMHAYFTELEDWMQRNYTGYAAYRPEWSKGFAFSESGPCSDLDALRTTVPAMFASGSPTWHDACAMLRALDPHGVFSNPFLERWMHGSERHRAE